LFWAQRGAAKLKPNMTELDGDIQVIQTKRNGYSEGPIFFKRKGIYYYMYTLSGHEHYAYAYQYSKVSPFGSL
jgi:beta-xylosidase